MIDFTIVILYLGTALLIGLLVSRNITNTEYETGGKQYSSWAIFATLSASYMGGGFTLGLAEKTFRYGIIYILAIWGFSFKEILLGLFVAPRIKNFPHAITAGDIMAQAFGRQAQVFTGLASVLVCGGIIGAQISSCGYIFQTFLSIPHGIGSCLTALVILLYATMGGLKSVVAVDRLHFFLLAFMLPLVAVFGIYAAGGLPSLQAHIPSSHWQIPSYGNLLILFLSFFLGETLIPPYVQRLLIGKTTEQTTKGTLWSGLWSLPFFFLMGIIGFVALLLKPDLDPKLALPFVILNTMPLGLKGLAVAATLAVVMSSADSFLNATTMALRRDVFETLNLYPQDSKRALLVSRFMTFSIGIVAFVFVTQISSVADILLYSYQFWTPLILGPLLAALFGFQGNEKIFFLSATSGMISLLAWNLLSTTPSSLEGSLEGVLVGVLTNTAVFFCLSASSAYRHRRN